MYIHIKSSSIVYEKRIQKLCCTPYYNHKNGCPNYGNKKGCPPNQLLINEILDFNNDMYIVYTEFDIKSHVENMRNKHPNWTERQLYCCLYWQPKARKIHKRNIENATWEMESIKIILCPEAHGVNVTDTMKNVGIELEWFPKNIARIVSLIGYGRIE